MNTRLATNDINNTNEYDLRPVNCLWSTDGDGLLVYYFSGEAKFFEYNFYLECSVEPACFFTDGFVVTNEPVLHGTNSDPIYAGEFGKVVGPDFGVIFRSAHTISYLILFLLFNYNIPGNRLPVWQAVRIVG